MPIVTEFKDLNPDIQAVLNDLVPAVLSHMLPQGIDTLIEVEKNRKIKIDTQEAVRILENKFCTAVEEYLRQFIVSYFSSFNADIVIKANLSNITDLGDMGAEYIYTQLLAVEGLIEERRLNEAHKLINNITALWNNYFAINLFPIALKKLVDSIRAEYPNNEYMKLLATGLNGTAQTRDYFRYERAEYIKKLEEKIDEEIDEDQSAKNLHRETVNRSMDRDLDTDPDSEDEDSEEELNQDNQKLVVFKGGQKKNVNFYLPDTQSGEDLKWEFGLGRRYRDQAASSSSATKAISIPKPKPRLPGMKAADKWRIYRGQDNKSGILCRGDHVINMFKLCESDEEISNALHLGILPITRQDQERILGKGLDSGNTHYIQDLVKIIFHKQEEQKLLQNQSAQNATVVVSTPARLQEEASHSINEGEQQDNGQQLIPAQVAQPIPDANTQKKAPPRVRDVADSDVIAVKDMLFFLSGAALTIFTLLPLAKWSLSDANIHILGFASCLLLFGYVIYDDPTEVWQDSSNSTDGFITNCRHNIAFWIKQRLKSACAWGAKQMADIAWPSILETMPEHMKRFFSTLKVQQKDNVTGNNGTGSVPAYVPPSPSSSSSGQLTSSPQYLPSGGSGANQSAAPQQPAAATPSQLEQNTIPMIPASDSQSPKRDVP